MPGTGAARRWCALATAVVLVTLAAPSHALAAEEPADPGHRDPAGVDHVEASLAEAARASARAEAVQAEHLAQVAAVQAAQNETGMTWPDQELALMASGRALTEAEAAVDVALDVALDAATSAPDAAQHLPWLAQRAETLAAAAERRRGERSRSISAPAAPGFDQRGDLERLAEHLERLADPPPATGGFTEYVTAVRDAVDAIGPDRPDELAARLDELEHGYEDEIDAVLGALRGLEADTRARLAEVTAHRDALDARLAELRALRASDDTYAVDLARAEPLARAERRLAADLTRVEERLAALEADLVGATELLRASDRLDQVPTLVRDGFVDPAAVTALTGLTRPRDALDRAPAVLASAPEAAAWRPARDASRGVEAVRERIVEPRDRVAEAELRLAATRAGAGAAAGVDESSTEEALATERRWARDGLRSATIEAALAFAEDALLDAAYEEAAGRVLVALSGGSDTALAAVDDTPDGRGGESADALALTEPLRFADPQRIREQWQPVADAAGKPLALALHDRWVRTLARTQEAVARARARWRAAPVRGPLVVSAGRRARAGGPERVLDARDELPDQDWETLATPAGAVTVDGVGADGAVVVAGLAVHDAPVEIRARPFVAPDPRTSAATCLVPVAGAVVYQERDHGGALVTERALDGVVRELADAGVAIALDPATLPVPDHRRSATRHVVVRYRPAAPDGCPADKTAPAPGRRPGRVSSAGPARSG